MQKPENKGATPTYRSEETTQGILVYHVNHALSKAEAARLMREVEQALSNGKAKIILDLSTESATSPHGYGYLEKTFRGLRGLAQKLQGDIKYVLPQKIADRIAGTLPNLSTAIQSLAESTSEEEIQEEHIKLKEQVIFQEAQIKKLTAEVNLLTKKTRELGVLISQPSTDKELRAAVEHYRNMASQIQIAPPAQKGEKPSI